MRLKEVSRKELIGMWSVYKASFGSIGSSLWANLMYSKRV